MVPFTVEEAAAYSLLPNELVKKNFTEGDHGFRRFFLPRSARMKSPPFSSSPKGLIVLGLGGALALAFLFLRRN